MILGLNEAQKTYAKNLIAKGFEPEERYDIKDNKGERTALLDENISKQREQQVALLPGHISDLNEKVVNPRNKAYLR